MAVIPDDQATASVYLVVRVGFVNAKLADARAQEISGESPPDGPRETLPLPTVTVRSDQRDRIYRLPMELNNWAIDMVALAHAGQNLFPCEVEFGILDERPFAEFVLVETRNN